MVKKLIAFRCEEDALARAKQAAADRGWTLTALITRAMEAYIGGEPLPAPLDSMVAELDPRIDALRGKRTRSEMIRAALDAYLAGLEFANPVGPGKRTRSDPVLTVGGTDPLGPAIGLCPHCGGGRGMHQRGCKG